MAAPLQRQLRGRARGRSKALWRKGSPVNHFESYVAAATQAMSRLDLEAVERLATALRDAWAFDRQVFLCGNGGSAANAIHLANDLLYGVGKDVGRGMRVHALPANSAVLTCLANDESYEAVFAKQLDALARPGDLLIALSGSGNSLNIVEAIRAAARGGVKSFAVLGFSGGRCLELADDAIHVAIDDMQVSEDFQLVVGHMVMQWLRAHPPQVEKVVPLGEPPLRLRAL